MDKKIIIKMFKTNVKSCDNRSRVIVVCYNTTKVNGGYLDKIGVVNDMSAYKGTKKICTINLKKLSYWVQKRNAKITSRVSWLIGMLANGE